MNADLFKDMVAGFVEAKKYRAGRPAKLRVSHLAFAPVKLGPMGIRKIRTHLGFSQDLFAQFLGTSKGTIRSWEQGLRSPHNTALRLLAIAKESPAVLLQKTEVFHIAHKRTANANAYSTSANPGVWRDQTKTGVHHKAKRSGRRSAAR